MAIWRRLESWLSWFPWYRRRARDADLARELRDHLDLEADEQRAAGLSPEQAAYAAHRALGNTLMIEEDVRAARGFQWFETLAQDIRYGLRMLRKSPGFTAIAVLTLALGIGANTAIFTLIDGIMLRTLPVAKPGQLYRLGDTHQCCNIGGVQDHWSIFSYPLYERLRDHTPQFSEMSAFSGELPEFGVRRSGSSAPAVPLEGELVSGNYFSMLGLRAFAGRLIDPTDDTANAAPAAVISYRVWQRDFGAQPSVIGATFVVNTMPFTVIGITPPSFYGDRMIPDPPDLWIPLATEPALDGPNSLLKRTDSNWLYIIGRLQPGKNLTNVQSEVTVELRNWLRVQPGLSGHDRNETTKTQIILSQAGAGIDILQHESASGLWLLAAISGLVLLITCANIANLLLLRGTGRRAETAIRLALGAPRVRLMCQVITESLLVALLGGLAGFCAAFVGVRIILLLAFRGAGYVPVSASPSLIVLGFAFLLSLITGIAFGIAPAWVGSRCEPAQALHGTGRSITDRGSSARRSLVALQLALSVTLLVGAGLLTRSLRNLENQKLGFQPEGRLIVKLNPTSAGYKPGELYGLYQQLQERLPRIPGVVSASWSNYGPMEDSNSEWTIQVEGHPPGERIFSSFDLVSPNFFKTMGTRILFGRDITEADTPTSRAVAVVNEAFVKQYLHGKDPIGTHFGFANPGNAEDYQIVGVVEDTKFYNQRDYPMFFLPFLQKVPSEMTFLQYAGDIELRVAGKPENLGPAVRRALTTINPNLTMIKVVSLPEQIAENFNMERLIARLTELYGALALLLACVGLYGVAAYSVTRRTHELGIRVALGAQRGDILMIVLGEGFKLALIGVIVGVAEALALTRFLRTLLFEIQPTDLSTFVNAVVLLTLVALLACYIPARRAMRVDPMVALRYE